jgi:hypothetical protein
MTGEGFFFWVDGVVEYWASLQISLGPLVRMAKLDWRSIILVSVAASISFNRIDVRGV